MNFREENSGTSAPRIELTSLVDVVFLLVLFFAVSTTFPQTPAGVNINLPKMKNVKQVVTEKPLKIFVDKKGDIYDFNGPVTFLQLREVIKKRKNKTVIVDADKDATHGMVMRVLDFLKSSGVERILIAAEKNEGKENTGTPQKKR